MSAEAMYRSSVIKIHVTRRDYNYYQPWKFKDQKTAAGSGCIVEGGWILTNAHLVTNAVFIQVQRPGSSRRTIANVVHIDHDTDTALLSVTDDDFLLGTTPFVLGTLPQQNVSVTVYGFSEGGNDLSVTSGVVSRIEMVQYVHSQRLLLAFQVDAAINPGSSGGPVVSDGLLVGIVFQSHHASQLENVGYVVPVILIKHMIEGYRRKRSAGIPDLGFYWQQLGNSSLRQHLNLGSQEDGVLITETIAGGSVFEVVKRGDVLISIGEKTIERDGSVTCDFGRVNFQHLISSYYIGDVITLGVRRGDRALELATTLKPFVSLVPPPNPGRPPTYLILAGLIFTRLTYEYMETWGIRDSHFRLKHLYYDVLPTPARREVVLLNQVIPHAVTVGYHGVHAVVVSRVNNITVGDMSELAQALSTPVNGRHVIEIEYLGPRYRSGASEESFGTLLVIDADSAAEATNDILQQFGIPYDRSSDLRCPLGDAESS